MGKSQAYKAQPKPTLASTEIAGPHLANTTLGVIAIFILAVAGWIGWNAWQTGQRGFVPAAPAPVAIVTNAPVVGQPQSGAKVAEVKPVALADIPGNIATGQPASDFTVRTMDGGQFALADHAGQPTLILFMASWCGPCIYEAINLAQVHAQYKDRGLNVIALDVQDGDTDAELQVFREAAGNPDYIWAFDDEYMVTQAYNVRSLDTTILIDQAGKIVFRDEYPTPLEPLLQAVAGVLP
jgi:thiol-disulfide isomerase/thioredoxin